jgi:hypothetical protein
MTCQNVTGVLRVSIGFAFCVGSLFLSACSSQPVARGLSDLLPKDGAWEVRDFYAPWGLVRGMGRGHGEELVIYIEGDGRAYLSNGVVSGDPTPGRPVALDLAKADRSGAEVLYMARPCQYVGPPMPKECLRRELYTTERWSEAVVDAYTKLIAQEAKGRPVTLVGFSGGAYLALGAASRLPVGAVKEVRTYGGNLLPNHTQAHHRAERLEVAAVDWTKLAGVPMVHYVGSRDKVIPADMRAAVEVQVRHAPAVWRWVEVEADHLEGWPRP